MTDTDVEEEPSGWEMCGDATIMAGAALEWWLCHRPVPAF